MYNEHFGFRESPFNQTPDSEFFYPSEGHKAALNALLYAVENRKGFAVLSGEIGAGKTTVARSLLRKLSTNVKSAMIINSKLSPKGVIYMIMEDLGVPYQSGPKEKMLMQFNHFLLDQVSKDKNILILVDEAQNLSASCLEEIRMLSNLETEKEKLVQIILMGQPELKAKLELPSLRQLKQRVAVHYHLESLSVQDTKEYIYHRLNCVKSNGRDMSSVFQSDAMDLIYEVSHGVPRIINNICDYSLLIAYVSNQQQVGADMIREAYQTVVNV